MRIRITAALAALALGGCAHWTPETRKLETVYQAVHAVDALQTVAIARNTPEYREDRASWAIGREPSVPEAVAWGAGMALVHLYVTDWLERRDAPRWLRRTWQAVTIASSGYDVAENWRIGLRFGWANESERPSEKLARRQ